MTELRRRLRKAGVEYVVIKNTLAVARGERERSDRARGCAARPGMVIGKDPVAAAKVLTDFAKEFEQKPDVKGGLARRARRSTPAQVKRLATMPPRDRMLAELGAGLQSPLAGICRRAERPAVHVRRGARGAARAARGARQE